MSDLQALFSKAVQFHQQGLLQEAKAKYLNVIEVLPDNVNILSNLGILCRDMGELEDALSYCLRGVDSAPDDPTQHLNLGAVYEAQGKILEAQNCYKKALRLDPNQPKALNNLGKILHLQGKSEKGVEMIQRAVAIDPTSPLALNNLGVILSGRGDIPAAILHIERSLQLEPQNIDTLYNLAGLYNCQSQEDKAVELLGRLLMLDPDHAPANHMLAALKGIATETAPQQYITETFDQYASRFDQHIQHVLGYTVPTALAEMVATLAPGSRFSNSLDLGCGTGLSGEPFVSLTDHLTGVDISPQMLQRAKEKNIYNRLECTEIYSFLDEEHHCYDLIIAADVFIYLGALEPFFHKLHRLAASDAIFACSIERCGKASNYSLRSSGRYAHSEEYLLSSAQAVGFTQLGHKEHPIRKENNNWIAGDLYLFKNNQ